MKCGMCDGKGVRDYAPGGLTPTCPRCLGSGSLREEEPEAEVEATDSAIPIRPLEFLPDPKVEWVNDKGPWVPAKTGVNVVITSNKSSLDVINDWPDSDAKRFKKQAAGVVIFNRGQLGWQWCPPNPWVPHMVAGIVSDHLERWEPSEKADLPMEAQYHLALARTTTAIAAIISKLLPEGHMLCTWDPLGDACHGMIGIGASFVGRSIVSSSLRTPNERTEAVAKALGVKVEPTTISALII